MDLSATHKKIIAAVGTIAAVALAWRFLARRSDALQVDAAARRLAPAPVRELLVYPVNRCRGIKPTKWLLTRNGLALDREFLLLDAKTGAKTAAPALCAVQTRYVRGGVDISDGSDLAALQRRADVVLVCEIAGDYVMTPEQKERWPTTPLRVPLSAAASPPSGDDDDEDGKSKKQKQERVVAVERFGSRSDRGGIDCGDEAAAWFSAVMGADVRLVRANPDALRCPADNTDHAGSGATAKNRIAFMCFGHLHLITEPSLAELAAQLRKRGALAAGADPDKFAVVERFRGNVLLGTQAGQQPSECAFFEEEWKDIDIYSTDGAAGDGSEQGGGANKRQRRIASLLWGKHTDRCSTTFTDPFTGERDARLEPLRTLGLFHAAQHPEQRAHFAALQSKSNSGAPDEAAAPPRPKPQFGTEVFVAACYGGDDDEGAASESVVLRVGDLFVPTSLKPPLIIEPMHSS